MAVSPYKIIWFIFSHGNAVAGVIVGKRHNNACGVGLAYDATVAGNLMPRFLFTESNK